jgi:hypothetical protein
MSIIHNEPTTSFECQDVNPEVYLLLGRSYTV